MNEPKKDADAGACHWRRRVHRLIPGCAPPFARRVGPDPRQPPDRQAFDCAGNGRAIELVDGDIQGYERVHDPVAGSEVVYHQAAPRFRGRSRAESLLERVIQYEHRFRAAHRHW
jgi:hypothetical protein